MPLVEAAQAGIPVVANDLSVLREVLAIDGEPCALFVDAANPETFAAAVQRLLDDGALRASLTVRGREAFAALFVRRDDRRLSRADRDGTLFAADRAVA